MTPYHYHFNSDPNRAIDYSESHSARLPIQCGLEHCESFEEDPCDSDPALDVSITDEALAVMEGRASLYGQPAFRNSGPPFAQYALDVPRLIADLHASRERIKELEESITYCSGSCTL